jgi:flagellar hook-associated protein 3 FlgL
MLMRVATFALANQMINSALNTQGVEANDQLEEASGSISQDYAGYGASSKQVINLQTSVTLSQSYVTAATNASNKANVMSSAMTSITNLLSSFEATLTGATGAASVDPATVVEAAQNDLQQMAADLNSQFGDEYLFGGSDTTTAPVNVSATAYPALTSPSSPDTQYYQGNDDIASVRVSSTETVSYGVNADNPAFEQGLRALNLVANASPLSTATLTEALGLTQSAVKGVATAQASLGLASNAMTTASASETDFQNFAQNASSDLTGVDVAAITAQMSASDAQLQASFAAIGKIESVSLASFLH